MIKLYDNLLEYQSQLLNLEKDNPDQSYLIDLNFRNKVYSASKIFYVGLFYLLNRKYEEVYTIMHHIIERIAEINEVYETNNLSGISLLRELKEQLEVIENLSRFVISKSYVKMIKQKSTALNQASGNKANKMVVDSEVTQTTTTKKEKTKLKFHTYLLDEMQLTREELTPESFALFKDNVKISYEEYKEALDKNNYNNYSSIIQIPPNTQQLNPKPVIYDLTFLRFQYPDLTEKIKESNKGLFGRAMGYFFNK